jgi:hypothetical protein
VPSVGDIASVLIVALSIAFIGWAMILLASRVDKLSTAL